VNVRLRSLFVRLPVLCMLVLTSWVHSGPVPASAAEKLRSGVAETASIGAPTVVSSLSGRRVPTFVYHHVVPNPTDSSSITPAAFEAQLKALKASGYTGITARRLASAINSGTSLPAKTVLLTFDDGWQDQYRWAVPLLKKYGFKATFFIYPKTIASTPGTYMSKAQVAALSRAGFDIESHTWGHALMVKKTGETTSAFLSRWSIDIAKTRAWIRSVTGADPVALAYPHGFYDADSGTALQSASISLGFGVDGGVDAPGAATRYRLKRVLIFRATSLAAFKQTLISGVLPVAWVLPAPTADVTGTVVGLRGLVPTSVANLTSLQFQVDRVAVKTTVTANRMGRRVSATVRPTPGFHTVTLVGRNLSGRQYVASWGFVLKR
jgi:peptidoglycan/xylan/chitin deacetylase (PgdA/CDA1 family)